ncbi:hypothetical protein ACF0H5_001262 [Mactra antiquata]
MTSPLILLVCGAVLSGVIGSLFIIIALAVDSWQDVTYDISKLAKYTSANASSEYQTTLASSDYDYSTLIYSVSNGTATISQTTFYLYPFYSGVWKRCDQLTDTNRARLEAASSTLVPKCYTFVTDYDEENDNLPDWMKSIGRMQNSAASCFIVSLIDLAAAAVVGTLAIIQKQVSACMVTGVLYCMAGLFSVFGLTIFHTKMYYEKYQCYSFMRLQLPPAACEARSVNILWAIPLAWVGVIICVLAFGLWIFVTRAFRLIKSKTMI